MAMRIKAKVTIEEGDGLVVWNEDDSREAAQDMMSDILGRFGSGRAPNGKTWKPYSKDYARTHPGAPDMVDTGAMRAAVMAQADDDSAEVLIPPNHPTAEGWAYADAMRPLFGFSAAAVETIVGEFEERFDKRNGKKPTVMTPARARAKAAENRRKADRPRRKKTPKGG